MPLQSPIASPGSCACASGWKAGKQGTPDPLKATTENPDDVQMEAMQTKRHGQRARVLPQIQLPRESPFPEL